MPLKALKYFLYALLLYIEALKESLRHILLPRDFFSISFSFFPVFKVLRTSSKGFDGHTESYHSSKSHCSF